MNEPAGPAASIRKLCSALIERRQHGTQVKEAYHPTLDWDDTSHIGPGNDMVDPRNKMRVYGDRPHVCLMPGH